VIPPGMGDNQGMRLAGCLVALGLCACGSSSNGTTQAGGDAGGDVNADSGVMDGGGHDAPFAADAPQTDAPSPAPDGGAGVAFCESTYGVLKSAFEGCCPSGDTTTNDYIFIDAIMGVVLQTCEQELASAIARGRVQFDAAAAQTCEASFDQTAAQGECWPQIDPNQAGGPIFGASACSGKCGCSRCRCSCSRARSICAMPPART